MQETSLRFPSSEPPSSILVVIAPKGHGRSDLDSWTTTTLSTTTAGDDPRDASAETKFAFPESWKTDSPGAHPPSTHPPSFPCLTPACHMHRWPECSRCALNFLHGFASVEVAHIHFHAVSRSCFRVPLRRTQTQCSSSRASSWLRATGDSPPPLLFRPLCR